MCLSLFSSKSVVTDSEIRPMSIEIKELMEVTITRNDFILQVQ